MVSARLNEAPYENKLDFNCQRADFLNEGVVTRLFASRRTRVDENTRHEEVLVMAGERHCLLLAFYCSPPAFYIHFVMFRNLSSQLTKTETKSNSQKTLSPTLRTDIYTLLDQTKVWLAGSQPGDSASYGPLLSIIQKHFKDTKGPGLDLFNQAEGEIAVVVGGVTNMILELSKWEGLSAGMVMRTWVDGLVEAHLKSSNKSSVAKGVTRGFSQFTDVSLLTNDFATRIQIISCIKAGEDLSSGRLNFHFILWSQTPRGVSAEMKEAPLYSSPFITKYERAPT